MSTPVSTSSTDSQMHNNIMAAGSKDRPPMLGPGRYSQWRSRFLRNFLLLTGIGDEIYSTVDACNTSNEMWIAIERLQQGESLNVQDVRPTVLGIWELLLEMEKPSSQLLVGFNKWVKKEVNDIRAERIAKSANPLALLAAAQPYSDTYYQAPKPQRSNATSSSTRQRASTGHKGQKSRKIVALCKGKRKPKRVKDYAYHKEKMMMYKQAEQGVPLQAEQADYWHGKIQEVTPEDSSSTGQPLEQVQNYDESNVYDNVRRHSEQPESINDTYVLKKDDSNVTPDSSNICTNDNQVDQNVAECVDERVALANLNLDTEENKTILKQLKKANASLTQELEKCKTNLDETNSALGEAISCLKHDELVKKSLLTRSQRRRLSQRGTRSQFDLKVKEDKDIDKMIEMDKQLKFLNEIVYTRNQSIQTIHMLAPKCLTYNGRPTFANPRYLKKAQSRRPVL
ncbi:hypothetical protein Tco_0132269 [Tanacetum coccineum]